MSSEIRTHCWRGHKLTPENTRIRTTGNRECKTCNQETRQARKPARVAKVARAARASTTYLTIEQRFWPKVNQAPGQGPNGDCWEWMGANNCKGYGYGILNKTILSKSISAHRCSYQIHNGNIPVGLLVRHSCDNPRCVNPLHLSLGTHTDNARDRDIRGRNYATNKTHCKNGHELAGHNLIINKRTSKRCCRTCSNVSQRAHKARLAAA